MCCRFRYGSANRLDRRAGSPSRGYGGWVTDKSIIGNIDELIAEEHALREKATGQGLDDSDRTRIREVEQELDQCWDLLRQRRARREFHEDENAATVRPVNEVEHYQQ
jgi:hypothetical protein